MAAGAGPPKDGARQNKVFKVKNKQAANVQITADQLIREAQERRLEAVAPPPKQKIMDPEELNEFRMGKRKEFENAIRKNRSLIGNWIKYSAWEESQGEFERARSVYERALDVDHRNVTLWLKYSEMEMKSKQVNHARNIWDRAVSILPRANQFWYKYTYMEELLGNAAGARQIFERWMAWHPDEQAWQSYLNMEIRYGEIERARGIYERFILAHIDVKNWIKYAKFELHNSDPTKCRNVYERAVTFFGEDHMEETLYVAFARFEELQKEYERAKAIYKYALAKIPKAKAPELFNAYTQFEKKFGDRSGVENVIHDKRRFQYEEEVKTNPMNYDAWFDFLRLSEANGDIVKTRDVYERAISNVPPSPEKRLWRRYIYLWIYYALFEELEAKDVERARAVYSACLRLIPHTKFTFSKVWLLHAQFEIRQKDLQAARSILGAALGKCPKEKTFKGYIEIELQLREFDRCRTLYGKFLEFNAANCSTWVKFAELETILGDLDRARAIFELAVGQPLLDMPEVLWKAYIDFETELGEYDRTRDLYDRLLQKTQHVKVWIAYALFESSVESDDSTDQTRHVFETAYKEVKKSEDKSERLQLIEAWAVFEEKIGDAAGLKKVRAMLPKKVKKRREILAADGTSEGWEEYHDYLYPDDEASAPNKKLLDFAHAWKAKQQLLAKQQPPTEPESAAEIEPEEDESPD